MNDTKLVFNAELAVDDGQNKTKRLKGLIFIVIPAIISDFIPITVYEIFRISNSLYTCIHNAIK